ncbi:MAG TPA: hypothetical protein VK206_00355, partial [Anaerolineales bacterium]|nr:hypothetical protein [Anaerolineales bacterium]
CLKCGCRRWRCGNCAPSFRIVDAWSKLRPHLHLQCGASVIRNRLQSLLHKHNLMLSEEGLLDQAWWEARKRIKRLMSA